MPSPRSVNVAWLIRSYRRFRDLLQTNNQRPQSSSASRFTAGAAGFLNFSKSGDRPIDNASQALRYDPLQAHLRVCPGTSSGITKFSEHEAD
jgi:hypothetical protein